MYKVGLTGSIGVGKTTVSEMFAAHNIDVFDADLIAKDLTKQDSRYFNEIVTHFGDRVLTKNQLNRKMLRNIIFSDAHEKIWLEELLHPAILEQLISQSDNANSSYCILVIPLLIEKDLQHLVNRTLVVQADGDLQMARAMQRDESNKQLIESIKYNQASVEELLTHADDVITNNKALNDLKPQVLELHNSYLEHAKSS